MQHTSSHARAFTLTELLIVAALIAILVAVLVPTVVRERENARQNTCLSNLKQVALAATQYVQDNDGTFMPLSNAPYRLPARVAPYLKSQQLWRCPSAPLADEWDGTAPDYSVSYGFNGAWLYGQSLSKVGKSSETVLYAENLYDKAAQTGASTCCPRRGYPGLLMGVPVYRHFDHADVAFVDGHVKPLDLATLEQSATQEDGVPLAANNYAVLWNRL